MSLAKIETPQPHLIPGYLQFNLKHFHHKLVFISS